MATILDDRPTQTNPPSDNNPDESSISDFSSIPTQRLETGQDQSEQNIVSQERINEPLIKKPRQLANAETPQTQTEHLYQTPFQDPEIAKVFEIIKTDSSERFLKLGQRSMADWQNIKNIAETTAWDAFVEKYPTKAKAYGEKDWRNLPKELLPLKASLDRKKRIEQEKLQRTNSTSQTPTSYIPKTDNLFKAPVFQELAQSPQDTKGLNTMQSPSLARLFQSDVFQEPIRQAVSELRIARPSEPNPSSFAPRGKNLLDGLNNLMGSRGNPGILNGLGGGNPISTIKSVTTIARFIYALPIAVPVIIILIVIIIILLVFFGSESPTSPTLSSTQSNITSCQFTRSSQSNLIKSTILDQWITDAATKAGIPPSVLASVAMHESQDFLLSKDNASKEIASNHYCIQGPPFCELKGELLYDGECVSQDTFHGAKTGRATGLMQIVDVFNPGKDLCGITESLAVAANKLKTDGVTQQPLQSQINSAIFHYYNACTYGSYSYCNEVWTDYNNCKTASSGIISSTNSGITLAASQIIPLLSEGKDVCSLKTGKHCFDAKKDEGITGDGTVGNTYWCTYLIVDSYTKAGFTGLTRSSHASVIGMKTFFGNPQENGGHYILLSPSTPVEQLKSGYVIFFEGYDSSGKAEQHVSLINYIDVDPFFGNGAIHTYEANNVVTKDVVNVRNHIALNADTHNYAITGFGQSSQ